MSAGRTDLEVYVPLAGRAIYKFVITAKGRTENS